MRALIDTRESTLETSLEIREIPRPVPRATQVLIRVHACAYNVADYQRSPTPNTPQRSPSFTIRLMNRALGFIGQPLGAKIAGTVVDVGSNVTHLRVGDKVFGKTTGTSPRGGCTEYALMDAPRAHFMPTTWTFEQV